MKAKYTKMMKDIEENGKKRQTVFPGIESAMGEFSKERAVAKDPSGRGEFFKGLDDACNTYNEIYGNAQQGGHFHKQLGDLISRVMQTVNDYIMSRTMEKNDLVNTISSQNLGALGPQNPYTGRGAPMAPSPYEKVESQYYPGYGPPGAPAPPAYPGYPPAAPGGYPPRPGYGAPPGYPPQPTYQGYPPRPGYPPQYRY